MLLQPLETWRKICTASAHGIEMNGLAGLEGIHFVYLGVEVQNVNALRPLPFENRADLSFKESQQTTIDRAGAIYCNGNLSDALAHNSRQIKSVPDVASVGSHPTRICRDGI